MGSGYRIVGGGDSEQYGRALVEIELSDGRNTSQILLSEGLAQPWPNTGNIRFS
jgi:endonuclease YncB( thermonuclease family)